MQYNRERIEMLKQRYPEGTRVELMSMNDPHAVPTGTMGTIEMVDDAGTLHVSWDNGRSLGLVPGEDSFRIIGRQERNPPPPTQAAPKQEKPGKSHRQSR